MSISDAQLGRVVAHAMPGARLQAARPLGERTLLLALSGERRVVLRLAGPADAGAGDPLAAELAALGALRAEIDLPLPELLAHDLAGEAGTRYLLLSFLDGLPLPELVGDLGEEARYGLGRELGALAARVHGYTARAYGALDPAVPLDVGREPDDEAGDEDLRYAHARLDAAIAAARTAGELDSAGASRLVAWADEIAATGQPPCLTHGDLRPERVLLRRRERGWTIGGLVGWGFAQAWRPAWDHVAVMEHFAGPACFGLRVGYGSYYDESTERRYDQLREFALLPYRLVLYLEAGRADLALALLGEGELL